MFDNKNWPLNSMLVCRRHRVMFMPIAKNANTSLKRSFVRLSEHPEQNLILAGDVHSYLTSHATGLRLWDYTPDEARSMMEDEQYFRFVVLRNPLQRVTSGYLSKFVMDRQSAEPHDETPEVIGTAIDWVYARRNEPPDYERSITFEEFVDHVVSNDDEALDTHFRSQESYLAGLQFNFVGVLEDLRPLVRELESRFAQSAFLEHKNVTPRKKIMIGKGGLANQLPARLRAGKRLATDSQLMTSEIKEKLKRRFAGDIKLWEEASRSHR